MYQYQNSLTEHMICPFSLSLSLNQQPTTTPSQSPSNNPSQVPTSSPSSNPSKQPTNVPSVSPSKGPSVSPSRAPTSQVRGYPFDDVSLFFGFEPRLVSYPPLPHLMPNLTLLSLLYNISPDLYSQRRVQVRQSLQMMMINPHLTTLL